MLDQKMIDQVPVDDNETKPDDKPQSAPTPSLGTGIRGDGSGDAFGLGADDGRSLGRGGDNAAGRAGRWGWYASEVQVAIADALRRDPRVRRAHFQLEVRIWPDAAGRVTRARIKGSTGDPGLDQVIRQEILTGFQLPDPPPVGMPSPIVLRVGARPPD